MNLNKISEKYNFIHFIFSDQISELSSIEYLKLYYGYEIKDTDIIVNDIKKYKEISKSDYSEILYFHNNKELFRFDTDVFMDDQVYKTIIENEKSTFLPLKKIKISKFSNDLEFRNYKNSILIVDKIFGKSILIDDYQSDKTNTSINFDIRSIPYSVFYKDDTSALNTLLKYNDYLSEIGLDKIIIYSSVLVNLDMILYNVSVPYLFLKSDTLRIGRKEFQLISNGNEYFSLEIVMSDENYFINEDGGCGYIDSLCLFQIEFDDRDFSGDVSFVGELRFSHKKKNLLELSSISKVSLFKKKIDYSTFKVFFFEDKFITSNLDYIFSGLDNKIYNLDFLSKFKKNNVSILSFYIEEGYKYLLLKNRKEILLIRFDELKEEYDILYEINYDENSYPFAHILNKDNFLILTKDIIQFYRSDL